jgi:hypothetical protein
MKLELRSLLLKLITRPGIQSFLTSLAGVFLLATSLTGCSDQFANIQVGSVPQQAIPPTFMGFSHEWGHAQKMMGSSNTGVDTVYRQLINNLTSDGSGPIVVRIGGASTDTSGAPTSTTAEPFAELAQALGVHFILGVNLKSNNLPLATAQAQAYVSQMPSGYLDAIEIGNEPELVKNYSFESYMAQFSQWRNAILPLLPEGTKLAGPSWALMKSNDTNKAFLETESKYLSTFSQHHYAAGYTSPIPDDYLLTSAAAREGATEVTGTVRLSHQSGLSFRMDEINSISGGGKDNYSNTFQSALWAIDTMFNYANIGVDGVNWHTGYENGIYDAFIIHESKANGSNTFTLAEVRPIYYGLLFFQQAIGDQAHMLPLSINADSRISAWATINASQVIKIALLDKSLTSSGIARITLQGYSKAKIYRLTAPSYNAKSGIQFAGQTFDGSTDGKIQGTLAPEEFAPTSDGLFAIPMDPSSAALIVFEK